MHAYLIIGATQIDREKKIKELLARFRISPFECIYINEAELSIGIKEVRSFTNSISITPVQSKLLAGIIPNASKLTRESQQALLKTLEEPPPHAIIILATLYDSEILPTIISRCEVISISPASTFKTNEIYENMLTELKKDSPGKQIALLSTLSKSKEDLALFIDYAVNSLHISVIPNATVLKKLLSVKKYMKNNISILHLLENAFISLDNHHIIQ